MACLRQSTCWQEILLTTIGKLNKITHQVTELASISITSNIYSLFTSNIFVLKYHLSNMIENQAGTDEISRYLIFLDNLQEELKSILYYCRYNKDKENHPAKSEDLAFEGQDLSSDVKALYGDYDYEYDYVIKPENIDVLLVHLVKLCFKECVFSSPSDINNGLRKFSFHLKPGAGFDQEFVAE